MIYLLSSQMSPTHWEVTDVGDINVLNLLQTIVPACGQVRFCERLDDGGVRIHVNSNGIISVGSVLLDVHFVKSRASRLDDLSHRASSPSPSPRRSSGGLWAGCERVLGGRRLAPRRRDGRCALSWVGWID